MRYICFVTSDRNAIITSIRKKKHICSWNPVKYKKQL